MGPVRGVTGRESARVARPQVPCFRKSDNGHCARTGALIRSDCLHYRARLMRAGRLSHFSIRALPKRWLSNGPRLPPLPPLCQTEPRQYPVFSAHCVDGPGRPSIYYSAPLRSGRDQSASIRRAVGAKLDPPTGPARGPNPPRIGTEAASTAQAGFSNTTGSSPLSARRGQLRPATLCGPGPGGHALGVPMPRRPVGVE